MASVEQLWSGLYQTVQSAYTDTGLNPNFGIDWPTINSLQAVAAGSTPPLITLFDRGGTKNVTRAIGLEVGILTTKGTPGSTLTPASTTLIPGETLVLTGANAPFTDDTFYVNFPSTVGHSNLLAEYTAKAGDTLGDALTGLVAALNTISGLTATVVGSTIHLVSSFTEPVPVQVGVVNVGSIYTEVYRQMRDIQITLWAKTPKDRETYGTVLEQLFANLEFNYGIQLPDQSMCRLLICSDDVCKDSQLNDLFRRDWIISADYPVLIKDPIWEVISTFAYANTNENLPIQL
jgi:hypothetical protein